MVLEADGQQWPTGGTYLKVRAPELLKFTWADPGDNEADAPVVTVSLRELAGDRCEMTFHLLGIANDSGDEHGVYDGWTEAFEELDTALAS